MINNWDARANWRLMMAPPGVIDYIIINELANLREPNRFVLVTRRGI
jgi:predicted metal-dependent hydrolase